MNIKKLSLSFFMTLFCCASCAAQSDECILSQDKFAEFIKDGNIKLIDVRTPEEFSEGYIDGAVNINYNSPQFVELVANSFDTTQSLAIYCRSGVRSDHAASLLKKKGFKVYQLKSGISKWNGEIKKGNI